MTREDDLKGLMVKGLAGDARAHGELLRLIVPLLTTYFERRVRGTALDAEDLAQDCLIAVHQKRATYDVERPFTVWLFAIARYKLIDAYRRQRVSVPVEVLDEMGGAPGFEDESSARLDVERLLATLPPKQAAAIRSTKLDGESLADHARSSGLSLADVKISIHRGLKSLGARLGREG
jgi:RNA polymerase sigma-70 factor (ECF subfamily)